MSIESLHAFLTSNGTICWYKKIFQRRKKFTACVHALRHSQMIGELLRQRRHLASKKRSFEIFDDAMHEAGSQRGRQRAGSALLCKDKVGGGSEAAHGCAFARGDAVTLLRLTVNNLRIWDCTTLLNVSWGLFCSDADDAKTSLEEFTLDFFQPHWTQALQPDPLCLLCSPMISRYNYISCKNGALPQHCGLTKTCAE